MLTCLVSSSDTLPYILLYASYTFPRASLWSMLLSITQNICIPLNVFLFHQLYKSYIFFKTLLARHLCEEIHIFQRRLNYSMSLIEHNLYPLSSHRLNSAGIPCLSLHFTQETAQSTRGVFISIISLA